MGWVRRRSLIFYLNVTYFIEIYKSKKRWNSSRSNIMMQTFALCNTKLVNREEYFSRIIRFIQIVIKICQKKNNKKKG